LGAVSNQLAKPVVLAVAAAYSFGLVVLLTWTPEARLLGWGFLGVGAALARVACQALLPAAAEGMRTPPSRLHSRVAAGTVVAVAAGFWIGADLQHDAGAWFWIAGLTGSLYVLAALVVLPLSFARDVRPPIEDKPVAGFFRECLTIGRDSEARACL